MIGGAQLATRLINY